MLHLSLVSSLFFYFLLSSSLLVSSPLSLFPLPASIPLPLPRLHTHICIPSDEPNMTCCENPGGCVNNFVSSNKNSSSKLPLLFVKCSSALLLLCEGVAALSTPPKTKKHAPSLFVYCNTKNKLARKIPPLTHTLTTPADARTHPQYSHTHTHNTRTPTSTLAHEHSAITNYTKKQKKTQNTSAHIPGMNG